MLEVCVNTVFADHMSEDSSAASYATPTPARWKRPLGDAALGPPTAEESLVAAALGMGLGHPSLRLGTVLAWCKEKFDKKDGVDGLTGLLLTLVAELGPSASVMDGFARVKAFLEKRDATMKEAEAKLSAMANRLERIVDSPPSASAASAASVPSAPLASAAPSAPITRRGLVRAATAHKLTLSTGAAPLAAAPTRADAKKMVCAVYKALNVEKSKLTLETLYSRAQEATSHLQRVVTLAAAMLEFANKEFFCFHERDDGKTSLLKVAADETTESCALGVILEAENAAVVIIAEHAKQLLFFLPC